MNPASRGEWSLLRRLLGALGAAPSEKAVLRSSATHAFCGRCLASTRTSASPSATAGFARAVQHLERRPSRVLPARAPAVAILAELSVLLSISTSALAFVPVAAADGTQPPPTTTASDAPPPDAYHPPTLAPKPKAAAVHRSAPVVRSAPSVRTRSYTPPAVTSSPRRVTPAYKRPTVHRHARVVHKKRKPVVHRHAKPAPVTVSLAPLADLLHAIQAPLPATTRHRDPYLRLAGLAFALLAASGLSLHALSVRFVGHPS